MKKSNYVTRFIEPFTIPSCPSCDSCIFHPSDSLTDVWYQYHRILQFDLLLDIRCDRHQLASCVLGFGLVDLCQLSGRLTHLDGYRLLVFTFLQVAWTPLAAGSRCLIPQSGAAHLDLIALVHLPVCRILLAWQRSSLIHILSQGLPSTTPWYVYVLSEPAIAEATQRLLL